MTIYDIAKEAGVAASTVSRVVNNKPGVKEETKERVKALLEKYNYTPNITARGLVMQSTKLIGILVQDIRVSHHIGSAFIVETEMTKLGYSCITMGTGHTGRQKAEAICKLEQRRVEGVVMIGSMFECPEVIEAIQQHLRDIPVVLINGTISLPNVSCILADEYQGVRDCVSLLHRKGKKNLVFVLDNTSPSNEHKRRGFVDEMKKVGVKEDDILYYEGYEGSVKGGYTATKEVLREHPETEGIIYVTDLIGVGGVRAAYDLGRKVPEDLLLVGIDNSVYGEICMPKLTTLDNRLEDSSHMAAKFLKEGLEGKINAQKLYLETEIIERESTAV